MDIGSISIAMSQVNVQQDASIALMKIVMDNGKENAIQMTDMMKSIAVDPNLGQHLDRMA